MDFDPNAYLAQADQPAPAEGQPQSADQPPAEQGGFDPNAFLEEANQAKYGGLKQQAISGLEGVGQGIAGPLAPMAEKALGVPEEDILGRQKANPITHGVGEAAGLIGGVATGVGEGALLEMAGKGAAELAGLSGGTSLAAKIGSSAVSQAAEMAVLQSGNEVSKMILNDPETSAQSAIANVGLAAALGGATGGFVTGAVNPLWKATVGPHVESFFTGFAGKLGGVEGALGDAEGLIARAGLETPEEIKAVIDGSPKAHQLHSALSQSDTSYAGKQYQEALHQYNNKAANKIVETLGRSPEQLEHLPDLDKAVAGRNMGESLVKEIETTSKPISEAYDKTNNEFKNLTIGTEDKRLIADKIAQESMEKGWNKAAGNSQMNLADSVMKSLSKQETVADLKNFMSNLRNEHPFGSPTYQAAKSIRNILSDAQESAITKGIIESGGSAEQGAAKIAEYRNLKSQYAGMMDKIESLNDHLKVGRYEGPGSFLENLKDMAVTNPEGLANRLSGISKSNILEVLGKDFPETLAHVKNYHVDSLLEKATRRAAPGSELNANNLVSNIDKMSPQIKNLIASPEQHETIQAVTKIMDRLKDPTHNWSNTARTIDKLTHGTPSALSFVASLMGHPVTGVVSHLGKLGFTEGKDALKLATLRFMSSPQKFEAPAFKAMVQFMNHTAKGLEAINTAIPLVFKPGAQVLSSKMMPDKAEMNKIDEFVNKANENPEILMKMTNGNTGYYLPGHQAALTQSAVQTVQYLQKLKPQPYQPGPLDKKIEPSAADQARYQRALQIAQQPMVVLNHIKQGTIQANDLADLKAMSPALYNLFSQKLSNSMTNAQADGHLIPYKTRMGISLFLGQPIDTSMAPSSIMAAQPQNKPAMQQNQPQQPKNMDKLGKSNNSYMTPGQASEARRNKD